MAPFPEISFVLTAELGMLDDQFLLSIIYHLFLLIDERKRGRIEAIGFGLGERAGELHPDISLEIVGHVAENHWNGRSTVQIEIKDFKTA